MVKVRAGLKGRLIVPYQASGVAWMLKHEHDIANPGGLLCDEMGLGKTVQTIATMIGNPKAHTLVVVPKAVVSQWVDAFTKFMGVGPLVVSAKDVNRHKVTPETLACHSVVLATYSCFVDRAGDTRSNPFHDFVFDRVILDEAHAIKNRKSKVHRSVVKIQGRIRWGLTGTPISKNLGDFASLLMFFGVTPLSKQQIMDMRQKYVLRRTKEDLCHLSDMLRLPACEVRLVTSPFRYEQERVQYEELKEEGRLRMKAMAVHGAEKDNNNFHVLEAILRLRQCVVNPAVLQEGLYRKGVKEAVEAGGDVPMAPAPWDGGATKMEMLLEELQKQPAEEKTLIFCHWAGEMDAIQEALAEKLGLESVRLDGSMSIEQRTWAIETFANDPNTNMFVIQIDCGGLGLNLQMATRVYINSLHWNAANELQAIGRAHRTGQTQHVVVTRLVIEDTIDEYLIKTQDGKLKITSETLNDPRIMKQLMDKGGKTMSLSTKDMMQIFEAR
jgi:SNF2 family DNA or RNA helicase